MVDQTLGHYRILDKLGAGGMGEVYRALDTTLDRQVALKILPAEVADDPDRLDRFEREAKALAALNHPNIVTIHTVEAVAELHFLTMELVEGKPLGQLLPAGGMPLDRFFDTAIALADALTAAHDKGIIHRDLKPANVMVTSEGRLKVLDFGLAKLRPERSPAEFSEMLTEPLTQEGVVVGTVPYMSPEQLEGQAVDARSDIFSLGVMLYEMATGQRPFSGLSSVSIISAIVKDTPEDLDQLREDLPRQLSRIVRHCLEKNPDDRFQTARDVRNELKDLQHESEVAKYSEAARPPAARPSKGAPRRSATLILLAVVALFVFLYLVSRERPAPTSVTDVGEPPRIVILPFENLGEPEDEYLADGITEEITSRLSAVRGLSVISRTTAMQYKESRPPLAQIGQDLDVDYALEGTVRWAQEAGGTTRVRVTPQLIDVSADTHLWSDSYDRVVDDIFSLQSELAQQVLTELNIALPDSERRTVAVRPTENLDAYQAYLHGKHLVAQPHFTLESWNRALASLERAVEIDPDFALAWAELARAHSRLVYFKVDPSQQRLALAHAAIRWAIAIDPDSPQIQLANGYYYLWAMRDAERAREALSKAFQRMPNSTEALEGLGEAARLQGHLDEAIGHYRRAADLSPLDPSPVVELALSCWWNREYDKALAACDRAAVLAPNSSWPHITKVLNDWSWKGGSEQARLALELVNPAHPWVPWLAFWQSVYQGRVADALAALDANPEEWIALKICIRPKDLLRSYALALQGEPELARAANERAAAMLEDKVRDHPEEARYRSSLGIALAQLGEHDRAIQEGKQAVELFPLSADAVYAEPLVEDLAHIYVLVEDYDSACAHLELLLSIPARVSTTSLESDPRWAPLRQHSCYQRLTESFSSSP